MISCTSTLLLPSLRAMTAHPMTGFHRTQGLPLAWKQCFRNTATLGSLLRFLSSEADSFRVRDSHPIPLFSEQACVSELCLRAFRLACSHLGRACATKAILFIFPNVSYTQKGFSEAMQTLLPRSLKISIDSVLLHAKTTELCPVARCSLLVAR